jgi:hypothetical protein
LRCLAWITEVPSITGVDCRGCRPEPLYVSSGVNISQLRRDADSRT